MYAARGTHWESHVVYQHKDQPSHFAQHEQGRIRFEALLSKMKRSLYVGCVDWLSVFQGESTPAIVLIEKSTNLPFAYVVGKTDQALRNLDRSFVFVRVFEWPPARC